mmetsp:Transcript_47291/g.101214  ORF Transcript_47291/g.101214 Transcript_47291/m.101214 type:complete len:168 (-) Transcript_47291:14-517(-)
MALVRELIARGTDPYSTPLGSLSPLMIAGFYGQVAVCEALLAYGVLVTSTSSRGQTALTLSHTSSLPCLLAAALADGGRQALLQHAVLGHAPVVRALLEGRASPDEATASGETALFVAVARGHVEVAEVLLAFMANPALRDQRGRAPMAVADARCSLVLQLYAMEYK